MRDELAKVCALCGTPYASMKRRNGGWVHRCIFGGYDQRDGSTEAWDGEGYELDDPKHPTYYERMADAADLARKRAKGGVMIIAYCDRCGEEIAPDAPAGCRVLIGKREWSFHLCRECQSVWRASMEEFLNAHYWKAVK